MNSARALARALDLYRQGDLAGAEARCREIIARHPDDPDALHLLGVMAEQFGQSENAVTLIRRALQRRPTSAEFHNNLGQCLQALARHEEALAAHQRALKLRPDFPEAHNNCGNALKALHRYPAAIAEYQEAIRLRPTYVKAWYNLGVALHLAGQQAAALEAFTEAVRLESNWSEGYARIGDLLRETGDCEKAVAAYQTALTLSPNDTATGNNLALALHALGRLDDAITTLQPILRSHPNLPAARINLASFLRERGDVTQSLANFRQILQESTLPVLFHSGYLFQLHNDPDVTAPALLAEHIKWSRTHTGGLPVLPRADPAPTDADRRLRIGYVSADLRQHPVGRNIHPLLAHHDHDRFEIHAYAHVDVPDAMTTRLRAQVDYWHDITALTDEQLAERIRADQIDILVDLSLHTDGNRLLAFVRRPAPLQLTFAGYPGTTGLTAIDYRLTDPFLDPPGTRDELYVERSFLLPHSFWCFDPIDDSTALSSRSRPEGAPVTWGCLNNAVKINDRVLDLWARILLATPGSRLLTLAHNAFHRSRISCALERHGIDPNRLDFLDKQPRPSYLESYNRCDIILDTFPYNGHSTTCDALWMGVPVVTLIGETAVGRGGLSLLGNLGLERLAARSDDEYVRIALELAGDRAALAQFHATLRSRMQASPLMDASGFARAIESAYHTLWRDRCGVAGT